VWRPATDIVFLQHPEEERKTSNTVRLARRLCPDFGIVSWPGRDAPLDFSAGSLVLFPLPEAEDLAPEELASGASLVIPDGTWAQCSRMARVLVRRGMAFRKLPNAVKHGWQVRHSSDPSRLSSAEAAAMALSLAGEVDAAESLADAVAVVGRKFLEMRGKVLTGRRPQNLSRSAPQSGIECLDFRDHD
jgi:DTW domain-containing protein YfiP